MKSSIKIAVTSIAIVLMILSCCDNNANSDLESSNCDDTTIPYTTVTIGNQIWMQKKNLKEEDGYTYYEDNQWPKMRLRLDRILYGNYSDFELIGYMSYPSIKAPMAI